MEYSQPTLDRYGGWLSGWCACLLALFFLTGCNSAAHQKAVQDYGFNYGQQLEIIRQMVVEQTKKNMLELELNDNGTIRKLVVGQQIQMPDIPEYRPPEDKVGQAWAGVANTGLRMLGWVGGAYVVGEALTNLAEAGGGNTSYGDVSGSFNSAGRDYNGMSAGRDIGRGSIDHTAVSDSFNDNRAWVNNGDGREPCIGCNTQGGGSGTNVSPPESPTPPPPPSGSP